MLPLGYLSAVSALLAAIACVVSARQRPPTVPTKQFLSVSNAGIPELIRKLRIQSNWSLCGAILAIVAAIMAVLQAAGVCSL
jgi:hypothetical protein